MRKNPLKTSPGFTIIELITVMAIIGILAAIAVPNYQSAIIKAREAVLAEDLYSFDTTIDQFHADKGRYPDSLEELVKEKYLHVIPKDPFTKSPDWVVFPPPPAGEGQQESKGTVGVVRSNSLLIGTNGVPYNEW